MIKHSTLFILGGLTFFKKCLIFLSIQINKPLFCNKRASPTATLKGTVTLTLVIARNYGIKDGAYVMFDFFRIKTKLELQLEEYIRFKLRYSPFIARDQEGMLKDFIKQMGHLTMNEIIPEEIENYHTTISQNMTKYVASNHMKAIRAFIRFHKHDSEIIPNKITNNGIADLQTVGKDVPVVPETRPKLGRPMNVELVKKIKRLRDNENLSFRAISKALGKDLKNVHVMYNYDISWSIVGKSKKSG